MAYTNATVIIAAVDQSATQVDFPGSFTSGFTDGTDTFHVCSGLWTDSDLSKVVNDVTWPRRVYFGDVQTVLLALNLKPVEVPLDSQSVV